MAKTEAIIQTQTKLQHRISRIMENLRKLGKEKITPIAVNRRLKTLEALWTSFQSSPSLLICAQTEEDKSRDYFAHDYYSLCETSYFANKDELLLLRQQLTETFDLALDAFSAIASRHTLAREPKILLPNFSGDYNA